MFPIMGATNPTGYNLTRSLRFRSSASAYLKRTLTGVSITKLSYSVWTKRGALGSDYTIQGSLNNVSNYFLLGFNSSDQLDFQIGGTANRRRTTQVFRDPSAWYHIYLVLDTTQATADNRIKIYVNGAQVTAFATNTTGVAQNANLPALSTTMEHDIGGYNAATAGFFYDGYLAEYYYLEGQALDVTSFGSTNTLTGVWQPARYTGTFTGTNSCYLPFTDNSALTTSLNVGLGKDFSGNGNYWTTNNISITAGTTYDSMTDVPTLTSATAANYCVMNPLQLNSVTLSNGNLTYLAGTNGSLNYPCGSTLGVSSGKFYWEITVTSLTLYLGVGIASTTDIAALVQNNLPIGFSSASYSVFQDGNKCNNSSTSAYQTGGYTTGDIIGVAFDATNGKIWFSKNNTFPNSGDPVAGTNAAFSSISANTYLPALSGNNSTLNANFGQRPFTYTPPTGYVALNTYNLPTSTIVKGNTVMDATLWTGDGTSPRTITNASGFKPDLVWFKSRSTTYYHQLADSVRGATKSIYSNVTNAEENNAINGYLSSINSNGFSVINGSTSGGSVNANGTTYVAWQWQAGQGTTSTNTSGTISATVSVNASAGFSVVTYTGNGSAGATLGHGLGVAPSLIFIKSLSATGYWIVYSSVNGATKYLTLNTTDAVLTNAGPFNNTAPTSSVFSVGNSADVNSNGTTYVAYCWTPIAGYSAFGSYSGNNSTDGPMVYTGFQPKFVLIKGTGNASGWQLQDSARNTYNVVNAVLRPDLSAAESTGYGGVIDFLSNGFKLRTSDTNYNNSGYGPYIYMAFASNPFKQSLAF